MKMDEIVGWLAGWWNWPFLLSLLIGILFILADFLLGGVSDLIGLDADADADVPDVDADVSVDADGEFDGPDPDVVAARGGSLLMSGLAWVGLGKVPVSVLLEVMLITFGVVGLLVNAVANDLVPAEWGSPIIFPVSLLCAAFAAPAVTKAVGGFIAKVVPADSTTSVKAGGFTGEVGVTATLVSSRTGQVRLAATEVHPPVLLNAKCAPDVSDSLPRGTEVYLSAYEPEGNIYLVVPTSNLEL